MSQGFDSRSKSRTPTPSRLGPGRRSWEKESDRLTARSLIVEIAFLVVPVDGGVSTAPTWRKLGRGPDLIESDRESTD
jgi:hypothetical protein